jgi:hypothetical protein
MIFSENRFPLFGIMRYGRTARPSLRLLGPEHVRIAVHRRVLGKPPPLRGHVKVLISNGLARNGSCDALAFGGTGSVLVKKQGFSTAPQQGGRTRSRAAPFR